MAEKSDKKVKVILSGAVTFKGKDYPAGEQELPEEAAKLAVKKKLGKIAGQEDEAEFTPLSLEETMERFQKGDSSDEVFQSLRFHQSAVVGGMKSGKSTKEVITENDKSKTGEGETETAGEGLPEDFPMRHVFAELGFKKVEDVQAKSREDLIALNGIGEASADKALAYGK